MMFRRKAAAFLLALSAAVSAGCAKEETPQTAETAESAQTISEPDYIPHSELLDCLYYDDREFHFYDEQSEVYDIAEPLCGVAPHHLTAGKLIAGMYRTAAQRTDIETVIIIAPMHYDSVNTLTTSYKGWQTAFGRVRCDTEITERFCGDLGAAADDEMTEYDHSASSHIPFIRRYLPDARVACLLISPKASRDIPERLSELLSDVMQTKRCFVAFSVDFSHYLDPEDAERSDEQTRNAVLGGDTAQIERFTNNNVDSPYCLSTFVRLAARLGTDVTECANSNTQRIVGLPYNRTDFPEGVTSYFVFFAGQ